MMLQDFFTLAEMKDGLTTLTRVEELVVIMQKLRQNDIRTVGDTSRQWSIVASTLLATENEDCLKHFIRLDGHCFLNQWLRETRNFSGDESGHSEEDSIKTLLRAIEKLPLDDERIAASRISETVKDLLDDKSLKVQEMARALFDRWNQVTDKNPDNHNAKTGGSCHEADAKFLTETEITGEDGCSKSPALEASPQKVVEEGSCLVEPAESKQQHSDAPRRVDVSQPTIIEDIRVPTSNQDSSVITLNKSSINESPGDVNAWSCSLGSNTFQESSSIADKSSACLGEGTNSVEIHSYCLPSSGKTDDRSSDVLEIKSIKNDVTEMNVQMNIKEGSANRVSKEETCVVSASSGLNEMVSSCTYPVNAEKFATGCTASHNIDENEGESCPRSPASSDHPHDNSRFELEHDSAATKSKKAIEFKSVGQDGDKVLHEFASCCGSMLSKVEGSETSSQRKDALEHVVNIQKPVSKSDSKVRRRKDPVRRRDIFKAMMDTKESNSRGHRELDMELDYGLDDALEVARQVAKEVEREVVDYRVRFCSSSSEQSLEGEIMQPSSPDSVELKRDEPMMKPLNENDSLSEHDLPDDRSSVKVKHLRISNSIGTEHGHGDCREGSESPHSTAVAQESVDNSNKSKCNFDLNDDACEIELPSMPVTNHPITLTALVPVIAALNVPPGSTSAFYPASPRTTRDGEKDSVVEVSGNCAKQRQDSLKIDLNVAESEDDAAVDLISVKCAPPSSDFPSGGSSFEVNSRRAKRLNLDLNRLGDNEDASTFALSDWRVEGQSQYHQNGNCSTSPAASSSSRHPSLRNFDLNDNPSFIDHPCSSHDHQQILHKLSSQDRIACGNFELDDPIVSLMVSRRDVDRTQSFLESSQGSGPSFVGATSRLGGGSGAQPAAVYASVPPATFGHCNFSMGPTMPLPPQSYGATGSIPYLIDSRGAPVVPHIQGSVSAVSPDLSRPPFLMNLMGTPSGPSEIGVSRSSLDLNSRMTSVDSGSGEAGSLRQLFFQRQSGIAEEQMKSAWQPDGARMVLKRKQPECGWELNMFG